MIGTRMKAPSTRWAPVRAATSRPPTNQARRRLAAVPLTLGVGSACRKCRPGDGEGLRAGVAVTVGAPGGARPVTIVLSRPSRPVARGRRLAWPTMPDQAGDTAPRTSRLGLAAVMLAAGTSHFVVPSFYERIVPQWIGHDRFVVRLSG